MTSPVSGHFRFREIPPCSDPHFIETNVSGLARTIMIVSFKEKLIRPDRIILFYHSKVFEDSIGRHRESKHRIRLSICHFTHVLISNVTKISMKVRCFFPAISEPFHLIFSLLPENEAPKELSSGLWNCSVHHYPSFRQHVACNLQTECEDGRDETEHCPFSSPECQGWVALCNRCYKFGKVRGMGRSYPDPVAALGQYCKSFGARVSFPMCVGDWSNALKKLVKTDWLSLWPALIGYYSHDTSVPTMYRHEILNEYSILYHYFNSRVMLHTGKTICFLFDKISLISQATCSNRLFHYLKPVCELRPNKTDMRRYHSRSIAPISTYNWSEGQQFVTKCHEGQVTHTFLLCGSNTYTICKGENVACKILYQPPSANEIVVANNLAIVFPLFMCQDQFTTLSYTLLCDFMTDCQDQSDESMCKYPVCVSEFTCVNRQCLPYDNVCDQMLHCQDKSDEECDFFKTLYIQYTYLPFPTTINFNGINKFTAVAMNSSDPCPDSHYRCPGEFNDCLPVYTRCNGMNDCIEHQDEEGCEGLICAGFFKCRASSICVHSDHLCDGWPHCPLRDDELVCDMCPVDCVCQGHVFLCFQPFPSTLFPQLRYLDATGSGMTLADVNDHSRLFHLILAKCSLTVLIKLNMSNLRILNLSGNKFQHINLTCFHGLENLHDLSMSNNPLTSLYTDYVSNIHQHGLTMLDLSYTLLTVLETQVFSSFYRLQKLNLTYTSIHTVSPSGFQFLPSLTALYMDGSPVETFPPDVFQYLPYLKIIVTQNHKLCCSQILPYNFDTSSCYAPRDEISSCEDLLPSWSYRAFLWMVACLSVSGNAFCCCARLFARSMSSSRSFSVFVISLNSADFLMGVYIVIIGVADEQFRGTYLHDDNTWKNSAICKMAGFLSLVSSEVSALTIWLITLDRFLVLHFPLSTMRFHRMSSTVACLITWLAGWFLGIIPLLPVTEKWGFYSQTGICIPLPVTRKNFEGRLYSFGILVILNFVLFSFLSIGQTLIYWSIRNNALKINTTKQIHDMTVAQRLISVAVTDFLCWFPVGICGIFATAGIPIPGEANVILAIFILPLNSAVNPFMYTFNILTEKRKKASEAKLLNWLESHSDVVFS